MHVSIRPLVAADYPALLAVADAAVPFDLPGNRRWLAMRQAFDDARQSRYHYVAVADDDTIVGYGGVEQQADAQEFRLFLVMDAARLNTPVSERLRERLWADLDRLQARTVIVREYAQDTPLLNYFAGLGFERAGLVWEMRRDVTLLPQNAGAAVRRPLEAHGVDFVTFGEARASDPELAVYLHKLFNGILADVAPAGTSPHVPFEQFTPFLERSDLRDDVSIVALHEGEYVGLFFLFADAIQSDNVIHGFLGTRQRYHAQNMPLALGWEALHAARRAGIAQLSAFVSEEDEDRIARNKLLGYEQAFGYVTLTLDRPAAER